MAEWNYDRLGEDEDDEENEEGGELGTQFGTRDGLIFLIDCSKPMFRKEPEQEDSHFDICIKCAKSSIQKKIIASDKDLLGIVFFGTDKSTDASEFKHIYVFHDLTSPGAEKVLQLEKILEGTNNDDFETKFGHNEDFSLAEALWTCSNMFSTCSQKLGFKRIMLFTNNDNPHSESPQLKRQAEVKAKDLRENHIDLELLHLNRPDKRFDVNAFYKDILFMDDDEQTELPDASELLDELMTRVRAKDHKKRALTRLPLKLGDGLHLSVGVYNLVRTCTKPAAVKLYAKSNAEVKTVTKTFLKDTGEVLMPQDIKKCQTYATRRIAFETEEVAQMKQFDKTGLELMGFKPRTLVKPYYHIRSSQFVYPDEETTHGGTTLFTAMLKKCLEKSVVAICRYTARKNTAPRFVALCPQEEELDEHKVQLTPPGFHLIFLPFADDFRKLKMEENLPKANLDQIEKAKELIKKLQFAFRSENFENPVLQQHYANVEAMALERDAPEKVTDFTLPDEEKIDKRAAKLVHEFKDLVFPDGYEPGAKRKAPGGGGAAKVPKMEDLSNIDIEKEAQEGRLGKMTVPALKEFVKTLKIKTTGTKKADLIDAITDHFGV